MYISLDSESHNWVTGLNKTGSAVDADPIKAAKKRLASRNEPLFRVSMAEYGNKFLKRSAIPREVCSVTFSTVIGIRGNLTIKIEIRPIKVRIRDEATITLPVHKPVLIKSFVSRRRLKAMMAVKNITGIVMYRPNRITISVRKETADSTEGFPLGRINAHATPRREAIRYFNHTFIVEKSIS